MTDVVALVSAIGAGLIGGVFFAFSAFVMQALAQLPPGQGVAAMQRINVVVLNPLFLGVFLGTALLAIAGFILAFLPWSAPRSLLMVAAAALYVVGCFGVTVAFNVPRNERLARLADTPDALAYWPAYVREWTRWNHVRTVASILSAALFAAAWGY